MIEQPMRYVPLLLLSLAYLVVAGLYAYYTPAWQAPDEPAHYNYVRQLAAGHLPVMEAGDYDEAYRNEVISSGFARQYSVASFEYEDWQPPLYYLLLLPVFRLTGGALLPLRLVTVGLGVVVVWLAYWVAWLVFRGPGRQGLALASAAFVAFLPQHVAMMAAVNNDALAEVVIGGILLLLIDNSKIPPIRNLFGLGLLLGLGFLTKATVLVIVPVVGLALLAWYWGRWRAMVRAGLVLFGTAALLGAIWWGRNLVVYGGVDVLGKAAHDAVVVGQLRTADWLAEIGLAAGLRAFVQTTYHSFWGQFGWMAVPMPAWVYRLLLIFTGATLLGYFRFWILDFGKKKRAGSRTRGLGDWGLEVADWRLGFGIWDLTVLLATFVFTLLLYLAYNVTFVQHQGRYLFPALIPIGIGVAAGWGWLWRPALQRWPLVGYLLAAGLAAGLIGLDLLALFRFIVPNL